MALAACPCCGGDAVYFPSLLDREFHQVGCNNSSCNTMSGIFPTKPMAASAWNKRVLTPSRRGAETDAHVEAVNLTDKASGQPANALNQEWRTGCETIPDIDQISAALNPLARLEVPAKPQGNAGAYSIRHDDIKITQRVKDEIDAIYKRASERELRKHEASWAEARRTGSRIIELEEKLRLARKWMHALTMGYTKEFGVEAYAKAIATIDATLSVTSDVQGGLQK